MGLGLCFLPSSKGLPRAVNASKPGQDIQSARLSWAQISKAELDFWEFFIYMYTRNYPSIRKKTKLENHAIW